MRLALVVLVACGATPTATLENRTPLRGPRCAHVTGTVFDHESMEALAGATLVASGGTTGEDVVITNDDGSFDIALTGDRHTLTVYYADATHVEQLSSGACGSLRIRLRQRSRPTL